MVFEGIEILKSIIKMEDKKRGEKKKKMKDLNAPKDPPSSYLLFCQDMRAQKE